MSNTVWSTSSRAGEPSHSDGGLAPPTVFPMFPGVVHDSYTRSATCVVESLSCLVLMLPGLFFLTKCVREVRVPLRPTRVREGSLSRVVPLTGLLSARQDGSWFTDGGARSGTVSFIH